MDNEGVSIAVLIAWRHRDVHPSWGQDDQSFLITNQGRNGDVWESVSSFEVDKGRSDGWEECTEIEVSLAKIMSHDI